MFEIQADLRTEYGILTSARRTAHMRRKANQGRHCFMNCNISRHEVSMRNICMWERKARAEKDKGLFPKEVLESQHDQDYYNKQKNHYQAIADAYTNWYDCCQEISQKRNNAYFFCYPWEVDFELPSSALESPLDGLLNES